MRRGHSQSPLTHEKSGRDKHCNSPLEPAGARRSLHRVGDSAQDVEVHVTMTVDEQGRWAGCDAQLRVRTVMLPPSVNSS